MKPSRVRTTGILASRIGRRFVVLFLGCALVPLLAFAWLTLSRVTDHMNAEIEAALRNGAKTAALSLAANLNQVAGDLAVVSELLSQDASQSGELSTLPARIAERCAALWLVDGGKVRRLLGANVVHLPIWLPQERAHLSTGKPLVRVIGSPPQLVMVISTRPGTQNAPLLAAVVEPGWFWDREELRSRGAEVAVFDLGGRALFHSFAVLPDPTDLMTAVRREPGSGTTEWTVGGEPHLVHYWRAFLRPSYDLDLLVVQSRSRRDALAVASSFEQWFVLTALFTLLFVMFASLVLLRRTLGPIVVLNDATRRVGQGDLSVRVSIRSRDEFGELGAAFNRMISHLMDSVKKREQTEYELVASRDAALAAATAKAEFVTNVSHEFRTPMTEILTASEILLELDDADEASRREFTSMALSGARRLAKLVDDVLELGSTAAWEMEPMDLAATLIDAVAAMSPEIWDRMRLDIPRDMPQVLVCGRRLTETWCRLLDNAAKFSEPDSHIDLRARHAGPEVMVEVSDQGVGISRQDLAHMFEPFRQFGRDQMTNKANGTGLGLTLAKNTIERHGGRIEVESELGKGTTIRVFLPVHAAASTPMLVGADGT
ncbi:MAG TPA: HAMP domain-containing sensor histidine kinase [Planctomycetota bacterium]|nr:HAMP domain-containing sensor histidine kinase [Planctomycetota bacterium]